MDDKLSIQKELEVLDTEYQIYIKPIRANWLRNNQVKSEDVYEVMRTEERVKAEEKILELNRYITQLAEAWWKERGWGIVWPDDNTRPMQVYKLEVV